MVTQPETPQDEQSSPLEQMLFEIKKVIVGQEAMLERIVVALLSRLFPRSRLARPAAS